ncbi:hypothetical protein VTN96DRAFT_8501 [Rasamsonia emersonii]
MAPKLPNLSALPGRTRAETQPNQQQSQDQIEGIPQPFESDFFTNTLLDESKSHEAGKEASSYQAQPARNFSSSARYGLLSGFDPSYYRDWLFEILSCVASFVVLIAIIVLLERYDQQPVPAWRQGITLNTLLALLATLCKAAFAYPVLQGISQLKWNWFTKRRPLIHFEAFDEASRGAVGSIRLLVATRGQISSVVVAAILISAIITSTITQAAVTTSTRYAPGDGTATVGRFISNKDASEGGIWNKTVPEFMESIWTPLNETYPRLAPTCTTGNCQFPPFSSLAVCVAMNDVTDQLNLTSLGLYPNSSFQMTKATLPNGLFLEMGYSEWGTLNISVPTNYESFTDAPNATLSFGNRPDLLRAGLVDVAVIYGNESWITDMHMYRAVEVLFHLCVESYEVQTVNGTASTTRTAVLTDVVTDMQPPDPLLTNSSNSDDGVIVLAGPKQDRQNYTAGLNLLLGISMPLVDLLPGTYRGAEILSVATPFSLALGWAVYHEGPFTSGNSTSYGGDEEMRQTILNIMQNIAIGVTNVLRSWGGSPQTGTPYQLETYVIIRWGYLAFLAAQVVLSALFLLWVMIQSRRLKTEVMKNSVLATLFAISSEDKALLEAEGEGEPSIIHQDGNSNNDMSTMAKRSTVKLIKGERGWRLGLVGRDDDDGDGDDNRVV